MKKLIIITALLVCLIGIIFSFTGFTYADEITESESNSTYQESKDKVSAVIEEYGIKEILLKYFDENLTDLIITCVVAFGGAILFLSYIIITTKRLLSCIKKFGIESDASREMISVLKGQLKDTEQAHKESVEAIKALKTNEEVLKSKLATILEVLKLSISNDISLVERGYADKIVAVIEGEEKKQ